MPVDFGAVAACHSISRRRKDVSRLGLSASFRRVRCLESDVMKKSSRDQ